MKSSSFYLKVSTIAALLLLESFFLINALVALIRINNYFTPPLELLLTIGLCLFLLSITSSLFVGVWNKWEQLYASSLPIALGVFIAMFTINQTYAVIMSLFTFALIAYDNYSSSLIKKHLITFYPKLILRNSPKTISFCFSIIAAVLVILKAGEQPVINVGDTVGNIVDKYLGKQINDQIQNQADELTSGQIQDLEEYGLPPGSYEIAKNSGLLETLTKSVPQVNLKDQIKNQVNEFIEPYKHFVNPVMGILAFGIVAFMGFFAKIAFLLSVDLVFAMATKSGLLKKELVQVQQEIVTF